MSLLVVDCPRCGARKITFDVRDQVLRSTQYDWRNIYELFSVYRGCHAPTIFIVGLHSDAYNAKDSFYKENALVSYKGGLNQFFKIEGFVNLRDNTRQKPPEYLPEEIANIFNEGAACLVSRCNNAAATMSTQSASK
jgi:hypothetical protein